LAAAYLIVEHYSVDKSPDRNPIGANRIAVVQQAHTAPND
jgi:hypothetical protein